MKTKRVDIRDRLDGMTLDEIALVIKDLKTYYGGESRIEFGTDADPWCDGEDYATVELEVKEEKDV